MWPTRPPSGTPDVRGPGDRAGDVAGIDWADIDTSTPTLVLRLDANVFHHGSLGAIRSLGRLGVPVYTVQEDPLAPLSASRYLRGRWLWKPGTLEPDRVLDGLARLSDRIGRRAVVLPTDDAGALLLAEHAPALRDRFLFATPPPDLPRALADKYRLSAVCRRHGFPTPQTAMPTSRVQVEEFVQRSGFPVMAKPVRPWGDVGRPKARTTLLRGRADLDRLIASWAPGEPLLLQEYIPGGPGADWFFHGYCDATSAVRPAFTGVKERSYPVDAGLTSFGRAVPNEALQADVEGLVARLSYRGLVDLDLRFDARDRRYKLLDFNPRLGAQFRVFEDRAGLDVVRSAYLHLTGQPVPDRTEWAGRSLLVENHDLLSSLHRRQERGLRSWVDAVRRADEFGWFARDDLAPFGLMCVRSAWRAASRPFGARGRASPGPPRVTAPPRYRRGRAVGAGTPGGHGAGTPGGHGAGTPGGHGAGTPGGHGAGSHHDHRTGDDAGRHDDHRTAATAWAIQH